MTATIQDVAAAAAVSVATVSRTLNTPDRVRADTRERVLGAVRRLGYRPNNAARSLRARASQVLGLIISDITNPFFTRMVRGVEDTAQKAGYSVVLANSDEDLSKEATYLEVAAAERMAGVILSPASRTRTSLEIPDEYGIPVVTVDRKLRGTPVDSVTIENVAAAMQATQHLLEAGCQRVAVVTGPRSATTATERLAGCRRELRFAGRALEKSLVRFADFRIEGGYRATRELLHSGERPDGLLVANNLMTIGALSALEEAGLECPNDITVVGFDDMSWALGGRARLALVAQPTYDIGRCATELLLSRVRGERFPPRQIVLPATLIPPEGRLARRTPWPAADDVVASGVAGS